MAGFSLKWEHKPKCDEWCDSQGCAVICCEDDAPCDFHAPTVRKNRLGKRLARFLALQMFSSGPDYSERKDLEQLMETVKPQGGDYCTAHAIIGFLQREGLLNV